MTNLLIAVTLVIGVFIVVALVGVVRGPTLLDRLLATVLAAANSVVLLVLIGFVFDRPEHFVDIGLAYALLAFMFPLAFAKYLDGRGQE